MIRVGLLVMVILVVTLAVAPFMGVRVPLLTMVVPPDIPVTNILTALLIRGVVLGILLIGVLSMLL
jgi:hypothetical protein